MLQNKAMLAHLKISQWGGRKTDQTVTAAVEAAHGARDSGRFNKMLVDKGLLKPITQFTSRLREYHHTMTLPWTDSGARLLPAAHFMDYSKKMREAKIEYATLVRTFEQKYPIEVQAARNRLGSMYDAGDYPDPSDISKEFAIDVSITPVPTANDFRVEFGIEAVEEIRGQINDSIAVKQAEAVKATFDRVREVVSKMHERLSDPKAIFKDTLVTNVSDLSKVLVGLNITNDPLIDRVAKTMQDQLVLPPSLLRGSNHIRAKIAEKAGELLAQLP
jgi:hypothetical protein